MGNPKPGFYVALLLVIAGLVGFAFYRFRTVAERPAAGAQAQKEMPEGNKGEAQDTTGITTKKEYDFVPAQRLPEVKGVSSYAPMKDRTVRMAINVWAGWAPLIYANEGFQPARSWKDAKGKPEGA